MPHKGWQLVGTEDLEDERAICEMCEVSEIRVIHHMSHPDYHKVLGCGCVCAEHMSDGYVDFKREERRAKARTVRRKKWVDAGWTRIGSGNLFKNSREATATVFPARSGGFMAVIDGRYTRAYENEDDAIRASFDLIDV